MYTMTGFEWDPRKAAANFAKHGVLFADAVAVLADDRAVTIPDHHFAEERWVTIGMDALARILTVVYTWRADNIRTFPPDPPVRRNAERIGDS